MYWLWWQSRYSNRPPLVLVLVVGYLLPLTRRLHRREQVRLLRRRDHCRRVSSRCRRHQVLHQGVLCQHQRGELQVGERLRRKFRLGSVPGSRADEVLLLGCDGIRGVLCPDLPGRRRLQSRRCQRCQEGCCCVAGEGEADLLHPRLRLPGHVRPLLRKSD